MLTELALAVLQDSVDEPPVTIAPGDTPMVALAGGMQEFDELPAVFGLAHDQRGKAFKQACFRRRTSRVVHGACRR